MPRPLAKFPVSAIIHQIERSELCGLARGRDLAKYKKKRARELKHDRFRDASMIVLDRLANKVEGRGRQILYGLLAVIVLAAGVYGFIQWRGRHTDEAEQAIGRAISIATAPIAATPAPGPRELSFTSEQERAQRAIEEFQKVAAKYGEPYRSEANYFIATNLLVTDHPKGISQLQSLTSGSGEVAVLAKFALAQAMEADASYDEAAKLYGEIAKLNLTTITPDTANLRLAAVYVKQGKKKEAADLLFAIVERGRKAKGADNKPLAESAAVREAAQELLKVDPARYAQLPQTAPDLSF